MQLYGSPDLDSLRSLLDLARHNQADRVCFVANVIQVKNTPPEIVAQWHIRNVMESPNNRFGVQHIKSVTLP